jgi:NAD(P)-dependent dehydrogenase (short-subunit alcohol dehydrogenase family)
MTAYITGGASGIGLAAAKNFAKKSIATVLLDISAEKLEQAASELRAAGGTCSSFLLDVSNADNVTEVFSAAERDAGRASILINAAGIGASGAAIDLPLEDWHRVMSINVTGTFLCAREGARQMMAQGKGGRIVNFASSLALRAGSGRVAYGTSKTAVIGLTRQLAVEWIASGITVNAIAPGWIETPMTGRLAQPLKDAYNARSPATRLGDVADIVAAIDYMTSDAAGFLNGHILVVDGGFTVFGLPNV